MMVSDTHVVVLTVTSLRSVVELERLIVSRLVSSEYYYENGVERIEALLSGGAICFGVSTSGGELIAMSALRIPGTSPENLGRDFDIDEASLSSVGHLELTIVHPAFRGLKLHANLTSIRLDFAKKMGLSRIYTTVHPMNFPSLLSLFSNGMRIVRLGRKYGGVLRYTLERKLDYPEFIPDKIEQKRVLSSDFSMISRLLNRGWVGVGASSDCTMIELVRID